MFLSYSVPSSKYEILHFLKSTKPLYFEGMSLGLTVTPEEKLSEETKRILEGDAYLKIQSMYIVWAVIGTLIWAYAGYICIP